MKDARRSFRFWLSLVHAIGVMIPRRLRAEWKQEWEAELVHRESMLADWDRLTWRSKFNLLWRSTSAFWDALWMQSYRLEDDMIQDLRFGFRILIRKPAFTLVAVLTLALGIGANTAIFTVVNALLLRSLPYVESDRLVMLAERTAAGERHEVAYPNYVDWRDRAQSFVGMAAAHTGSFIFTGADTPARLEGWIGNWNFFPLLGVKPQIGRLFTESDDKLGAPRTVVLSNECWRNRFGAQPDIIGRDLTLDGNLYTVIGVLPPGFEYLEPEDVYVPIGISLTPDSPMLGRGNSTDLYAVARLKPGVTIDQANNEMMSIGEQLEREYPVVNKGKSAQAESLQDVMSESVRQSLWILFAAVGFILLIACINVANLLLVRANERQKELALRIALGAGRSRIVRQLLSESLLVAILGGAAGLLTGYWILQALLAMAPPGIPYLSRARLDTAVLAFTVGLSFVTSLLCGLLPAVQASRSDLQTALKAGGRVVSGAMRNGVRKTLLIAEVSLSLVLLVGSGLLLRSMYNLLHVNLGFDAENLLTVRLRLPERYDQKSKINFYDECVRQVEATPGVKFASLTMSVPIRGSNWGSVFATFDKPLPPGDLPHSDFIRVTGNFFDTMGMKVVKGRSFTSADTADSAPVAMVNETLAKRIWPGEDPIGKRIKQGRDPKAPWREVIGVINDMKLNGVDQDTSMQTYILYPQDPSNGMAVVVRTMGQPLAMTPLVEDAIHKIDKDLPVFAVATMDQLLSLSLAQRRLTLILFTGLSVLALLLATVGIYGVMSYAVRQRTHELGIRIALGAQARDVLTMILKEGLILSSSGIFLGLVAAVVLTRWMETLLFGVKPIDISTLAAISALLLIVGLIACWIPARRATKVDPMRALRQE